jgi:pimeloyl-ACP methyl ester carboxylesterase
MNNIITISGWGQSSDSLANVAPEGALHLDYSKFANINDFFESIKGHNPDLVIGWSLGGQIALRAISEEIINPKALCLIATPYQFVVSKEIKCAMDRDTFNLFYRNFENDPVKTIRRFATLISLNDIHAHDILVKLRQGADIEHASKWLYWLEELENFSCNSLDFSKVPKTFAIHGRDDTLVDVTQTGLFKSLIKDYTLKVLENCGHAPHLHDSIQVSKIIQAAL